MRTAELTGAELDCWVEKCLNPEEKIFFNVDGWTLRWHRLPRPFSTDWSQGGPLVQIHRIMLVPHMLDGTWRAYIGGTGREGPDALVAAMRAFVASRYGDEVPDEETKE